MWSIDVLPFTSKRPSPPTPPVTRNTERSKKWFYITWIHEWKLQQTSSQISSTLPAYFDPNATCKSCWTESKVDARKLFCFLVSVCPHPHRQTNTHTHKHTHTHTRTRLHKKAHTRTHTHAHTHSHTNTQIQCNIILKVTSIKQSVLLGYLDGAWIWVSNCI